MEGSVSVFASRLFDVDEWAGTKTIFHPDGEGGFHLETLQDVEPVLEANKILHADVDERARYGEWTRVASIPLVVWEEWKKEGDVRDPNFLRKKLNDRDNLYFRTRPGRI
jgi:hypothetical protein